MRHLAVMSCGVPMLLPIRSQAGRFLTISTGDGFPDGLAARRVRFGHIDRSVETQVRSVAGRPPPSCQDASRLRARVTSTWMRRPA